VKRKRCESWLSVTRLACRITSSNLVPRQAIAVALCWLSRAPAVLLFQLHSYAMRINQCLAGTQDSSALHRHLIPDRVLRLLIGSVAVFALLFAGLSCRVVNDDTSVGSSLVHTGSSPFYEIDSLLQNGAQNQAVRLLRRMDPSEFGRMDILWRFVGAYNGRGMTVRCVEVLDSLQSSGWGDLTGWKISVLDLGHERELAVELVSADDVLLLGWLYRDDLELMPSVLSLPVPEHLGQRAARLLLAPEGITVGQLQLAASDVKYLPATIGSRVLSELEATCTSSNVPNE